MDSDKGTVTRELEAFERVAQCLAKYVFVANSEDSFQAQVKKALATDPLLEVAREVYAVSDRGARGFYDLQVEYFEPAPHGCRGARVLATIVLELKIAGSAAAVERQAQRYAMTNGIDLVAVVTTSRRLASSLSVGHSNTLGGKPFRALAVRTF